MTKVGCRVGSAQRTETTAESWVRGGRTQVLLGLLLNSGKLSSSSDPVHMLGKIPLLSGLLFSIYKMGWGQDQSGGIYPTERGQIDEDQES